MKIILTGGGSSAGHITPNLAIAHQLKQIDSKIETIYVGHKGDKLNEVAVDKTAIDHVYMVRAGKLRRYHSVGVRQLLDIPMLLKNLRDMWWVIVGLVQSYFLLRKLRPDCVFIKGSYVGAVVGLAAASLHIPFVTHDSDAVPGLGNRIVARWATKHAVALSADIYPYPKSKTVTVGVPVQPLFTKVTPTTQQKYKEELGFSKKDFVLFVTGGGQGAKRLNTAIVTIAPKLFKEIPNLRIVHLAGQVNESEINAIYDKRIKKSDRSRVDVKGYASDLYRYSAASDLVVTRAGATTMAELANQHKACIMIPNPFLTGGQQLKNAEFLTEKNAVMSVDEQTMQNNPEILAKMIVDLHNDPKERAILGSNLGTFSHPDAAKELAMLLLKQARK